MVGSLPSYYFSTELKNVEFGEGYYKSPIETTYQSYLDTREELFQGRKDKFVCLMDLALIAMRKLKKDGKLEDMEESDEINAMFCYCAYRDRLWGRTRNGGVAGVLLKMRHITILLR